MGMDGMSRIDKFLFVGEKLVFSLGKESPFGQEEIAATDRRVIHVKGDTFYDIKYESLVSLGCYTVYEWKWALLAVIAAATAMLMGGTITIPLRFLNNVSLDNLAHMMSFTVSLLLAFAGAMLLAFVLTIRSGIVMRTQFETRYFHYDRSRKRDAFDFVKIVRAAETGILKPHKSIGLDRPNADLEASVALSKKEKRSI
jgi:hypothetical protein